MKKGKSKKLSPGAVGEEYVACDNKNLFWDQLAKLLIATDTDGLAALRTKRHV